MSAPFRFKLKVKTGDAAVPAAAAPNGGQNAGFAAPAASQQPSASQAAAPSKPFKFKLKVAGVGGGGAAAAALPPATAPPVQQPAWDPAQAVAQPPRQEQWDVPPASIKTEAVAAPAAPIIKKIKLSTGKAAPAAAPAAPGGAGAPAVSKKPIIKFKPPPKQPRDAAAAAAINANGGADAPASLPIVRLTLPAVTAVAPAAGGAKRLKAKGPKGAKPPGGAGKKAKVKAGKVGGHDGGVVGKRAKRARSEFKELKDLDLTDDEVDEEDFDMELDAPVAPRTFTLRSSHAAAAAAPSSTGLGLSAGGPAPSDARTGVSGGAAAMDTAGTEFRDEPAPVARQREAKLPPLPAGPLPPPKREDFERLLARCQKKDVHSMFKEPVTEAIAPGYFAVIKQPMDFSTMKAKAAKGEYTTWEDLRTDMRLMFNNALTYNNEGGTVHNYAKLLMAQCDNIVERAMQGKLDLRSNAMITRKHNAAVKAQQRAEREKLRAEARAEQRAAQEAKVLKKAGLSTSYDEGDDENIRNSYRRHPRDPNVARWKGLGAGTNAEGASWGTGRQVLRPVNPWLPPGMYALSLARFAANLKGRARELVMQRARASTAADETAERLLQQQLAKKVPLPPPAPAPAAPPASAAAAAAAAAGRMPGTGLAQPSAMQAAMGAASAAAGSAAAATSAPAAMLAQQQLMMQAAAARPGGMLPGAGLARPQGMPGLPPGATITFMPTPQGMVPFLIQPGQPPIMMLTPGMQASMQKPGGMPGMLPLQPGFMPGMQPPRPAQ